MEKQNNKLKYLFLIQMDKLNAADIQLPAGIRRRLRKQNMANKTQPQIPRSKDERSDDIVIKSRPSPIKRKPLPARKMRELSDEPKPKPKPERVHRHAPIMPPVRDHKRDKREYEQLKAETSMAQQRLHYGTLERMHKTKSDMQRQALNKYAEDRRDERRHKEELERQALTKYTHDRMDERRHREELDRLMYRDRNDERMHRERLEHDMMDHFASDRSDERRFALDRMRIEHVEPLTKANIMTRQQSLLEQDAALNRHIKRRERNNQLIAAHQAYQAVSKADRFEHVLREFGIETLHHDDVYISPPVEESYMLGHNHYTYSILCVGVDEILWNQSDDLIIIKLINGARRVIPLNNQLYRPERFGNGTVVVIRFHRFIHMKETKRNPNRTCPFCPTCEIS